MSPTPEEEARENIDAALDKAGWKIQHVRDANIHAARGVAVREFPLKHGFGFADYLLYVDGKACGVVEAKPEGFTLTGVEGQASKYGEGLPKELPAHIRPLPFLYQSTGVETRFTNGLDPFPRSRPVFHFHRPETFADWIGAEPLPAPLPDRMPAHLLLQPSSLRGRIRLLPAVERKGLWEVQFNAVRNLERSLKDDRPRALIQMATGSGKTFTAITSSYRLIKKGGAKRILFLVDRANLGKQALKEFQLFASPDDGRKFTELYNVQRLTTNKVDPVAKVVITTIQRLYSMLKGEPDLDPALEEGSQYDTAGGLIQEPVPVAYNPAVPVEFFDTIFIDECHRSIYGLWRQVLEYFDAYLIGLTATPSKQTLGFFNQNLVMEYSHEEAVADRVNVEFEVYRIRTRISQQGSKVEAGPYEVIGVRDRETRAVRWEKLDEDLDYAANDLDKYVVTPDQIRTIVKTFKEKLFTEIFPGRTDVPKTLIYAKDDSHAEDIVKIVREEFGKGNDFAQKITYRTTVDTDDLIASFRNSYNPRIAVTVDMIATGTDIKPLEIVMFMRAVKSRNFFEQMKGRGVRVIDSNDLKAVTPDAVAKDHFVIIDCVGVCEKELSDTYPLERKRTVPFEKLLQAVAFGSTDKDILSSLAGRLARLDVRLQDRDRKELADLAGGQSIQQITAGIVSALNPDRHIEEARRAANLPEGQTPTPAQTAKAAETLLSRAAAPIAANPAFRTRLIDLKKSFEQAIDDISKDEVLVAGYSEEAKERAKTIVASFEKYIKEHKDEITALQILYSRPHRKRLTYADIKSLAETIQSPPQSWTPETLWRAYETLNKDKVRGAGAKRLLTDIVSLIRFALRQEDELVPFSEKVQSRFENWMAQQANRGRRFTKEQIEWLELVRDHIAASLGIDVDDFDAVPFNQKGGLGKAHQVFGGQLGPLLDELNEVLAA